MISLSLVVARVVRQSGFVDEYPAVAGVVHVDTDV